MTAEVSGGPPVVLSVEGVTKVYREVPAVQDLSFAVSAGEILGLVGPNGAGKTTALRTAAGVLRPTRGRVLVAGHDLATDPVEAKRLLSFVPDEPRQFEYLTVAEHLRFVGRLYQVLDPEPRIESLLSRMELVQKRDALASELSRGMKQKLAIACALLPSPSVLLLDEPLTGLDPAGMRHMKETIQAVARRGGAVLLSSHLLALVQELCTRLLILHHGRAVAVGTLDQIAAGRPELGGLGLEEIFLTLTGSPSPLAPLA